MEIPQDSSEKILPENVQSPNNAKSDFLLYGGVAVGFILFLATTLIAIYLFNTVFVEYKNSVVEFLNEVDSNNSAEFNSTEEQKRIERTSSTTEQKPTDIIPNNIETSSYSAKEVVINIPSDTDNTEDSDTEATSSTDNTYSETDEEKTTSSTSTGTTSSQSYQGTEENSCFYVYTIPSGKFKSSKCYEYEDYIALIKLKSSLDTFQLKYDSAERQEEITCENSISKSFDDLCDSAKKNKEIYKQEIENRELEIAKIIDRGVTT